MRQNQCGAEYRTRNLTIAALLFLVPLASDALDYDCVNAYYVGVIGFIGGEVIPKTA